jgi:spore coat polysaccharide biosynthesis protein SpsF (cytidylyltransferase family)
MKDIVAIIAVKKKSKRLKNKNILKIKKKTFIFLCNPATNKI